MTKTKPKEVNPEKYSYILHKPIFRKYTHILIYTISFMHVFLLIF